MVPAGQVARRINCDSSRSRGNWSRSGGASRRRERESFSRAKKLENFVLAPEFTTRTRKLDGGESVCVRESTREKEKARESYSGEYPVNTVRHTHYRGPLAYRHTHIHRYTALSWRAVVSLCAHLKRSLGAGLASARGITREQPGGNSSRRRRCPSGDRASELATLPLPAAPRLYCGNKSYHPVITAPITSLARDE